MEGSNRQEFVNIVLFQRVCIVWVVFWTSLEGRRLKKSLGQRFYRDKHYMTRCDVT